MGLERLWQNVRGAARNLKRTPGFSLVMVLTLALGIGASTAIFSVVNAVILRPLAYPQPEQLMYLTSRFPAQGFEQFWVSPPEYFEFREINQSFSAVGAFTTGEVNLTAGDRPLRVRSAGVDDGLLRALGVVPAQGRLFRPGEADLSGPPPAPGAPPVPLPPVVILSHELWRTAFGGASIVGTTVEVNGLPREVIGIMPPGVDVMNNRTEIWTPLGLNPSNRQNRGNHFLYLIGRLRDGVTADQATNELTALIQNWGERVGVKQHVYSPTGHALQMTPLHTQVVGSAAQAIWVLQAAVLLVLVIVCANLANLLLARAESRRREFALRTALGARRSTLLAQFLCEGVLLSLVGGALGVLLAQAGVAALIRVYPTSLPRTSEVSVDALVLLFTLGVSVATGALFGLAPLLHVRRDRLADSLKEGGSKGAVGGSRHWVRQGLVVAEVALALMLVIGAGLLLRTVANLTRVDAGFERSLLVTFGLTLPVADYPQPSARAALYQRLLSRLRETPGVQGATAMSGLPPDRPLNANDTDIDNYTAPPDGPFENVDFYQNVTTDYFETMGIPIVSGRSFRPSDAASDGMVAIVNQKLVDTFWKGQNPIGQRLRPCCGDQIPWFTVVGVAADVKQRGLDQTAGTEFYLLVDQTARQAPAIANAPSTMNLVLRSTLPVASLRPTIERVVREADPSVPVVRLREMDDVFNDTIRRPRLLAQLLGAFAALALMLAAIGTYGVLSYAVAERRREIGIRMALGAGRQRMLSQIMRQGLVLTGVGIVLGLGAAFGLNRLIASLLFDVQANDPTTVASVVATILLVALVACWLPAWRASQLDPNTVLRQE